jgi:hypothetical protein
MRKEDAIKTLKTNIYRELCKKWLMLQSPILAVVIADIIISYVLGYSIQLPTIALPASPLKVENVMPAIFTGTVTATSILIGFFSVSAHNFRHWLEDYVDRSSDRLSKIDTLHHRIIERKNKLERLEKETAKKEILEEIGKNKVENDDQIKKCEELKELVALNRNVYAHQQEHLNRFMLNYLFVSFYLLLGELATFLATPITSKAVGIFIYWTLISLNGVFNGLIVFMWEFMTYTVHKEMVT